MNKITFALTLSLTLAWVGSTALAQNATDNPPTVPADSKPPAKATKKADTKSSSKTARTAKKDDAKHVEATSLTPGPAVVTEKNVNVRGQAAINSEVVAHLKRGDHIQVLEEVTLKHPKTDEPAKWAKIALPSSAPVWVMSSFIDSNSKTVVPKKLNLRSGPGENFSVIGQLTKGATVKEVETKGNWTRIEPPADSYAFVAAHLISNEAAAPIAVASAQKTTPPPAVIPPVAVTPPPVTTPPPVETEVATAKPVAVGADPTATAPPPIVTPAVTVAPPRAATTPPAEVSKPATEPATPAGFVKPEPEEDVKRVVTREGIIKRSVSIQAPSYFVLENRDGKTINYLHSTNLVLKDFWGKHVMVSGEEELDERWPRTPVISIDKLETVR